MPLLCCCERESVLGQSIEEMLENKINIQGEKKYVPIEIQQFVTYLSERNAIQFKELFLNSSDPKDKNKLIKKINKAGNVDLRNTHDLHLVISVFLDFLRQMPGRVISKDMLVNLPLIKGNGKKSDIKKLNKNLRALPKQRYETLKYIMAFFAGRVNNNNCKIKINIEDILSVSPVVASAIAETPNDYTLSSKIYKNGNVINFNPDKDKAIDYIKIREDLVKFIISNYSKLFIKLKDKKGKKKQKSYRCNSIKFADDDFETKSYVRSCSPTYDSDPSSPKFHMRISSSPVQESSDSFSLNEHRSRYSQLLDTQNQYLHYDSDTINNKSNFDIQNLNCKLIGDKIHLSFTVITPEMASQNYKLEIPSSGVGMASVRNTSIGSNDSSTQLFRVTSFTEKPKCDSDSTIDNTKNFEVKLNLPIFQNSSKKLNKSNSYLNINYYGDNINDYNRSTNKRSIVVEPDESVITELQHFLKATRRYLYDLQSFPTGQIKELFKFSKQRYKLIKDVLAGAPYINLEPIIDSPLFGSNKCFVSYEGLTNLSLAQQTLMEYDSYMKNNDIKEFVFQKTNDQCRAEKEFLYQKLVILKDNIITENDRHILHELNKIYNLIRENLKKK